MKFWLPLPPEVPACTVIDPAPFVDTTVFDSCRMSRSASSRTSPAELLWTAASMVMAPVLVNSIIAGAAVPSLLVMDSPESSACVVTMTESSASSRMPPDSD